MLLLRYRLALAAIAAITAVSAWAPLYAQVAPSARIEGMGPDFSGIVDDPVTDAVFSPARLGVFDRTQVYVGRVPHLNWVLRFPEWEDYYTPETPVAETAPTSMVYEPFPPSSGSPATLTLFTPVGDGMTASFTADAMVYGNDDGVATTTLDPTTYVVDDGYTSGLQTSASRREYNDVRIDAALCSSRDPRARAWGVRATAEYKSYDNSYSRSSDYLSWPENDPSELIFSSSLRKDAGSTEQWNADATVAVYRPGRTLRDASVTAGFARVTFDEVAYRQGVLDEDYDNDGIDPDGGAPRYEFGESDHSSNRQYAGASASARAVFAYGERVRSVHTASFSMLGGDGDADISLSDVMRVTGTNDVTLQNLNYRYDGTITRIDASSALGFFEQVADGVGVAGVVLGRYTRDELDEDAAGSGDIMIGTWVDSVTFASSYTQSISVVHETLNLRLALAGEWQVNRYVVFRTGVVYNATRVEGNSSVQRVVPGLSALPDGARGIDASSNIDYVTGTGFRTGVGIRLAERLFVDLSATSLSYTAYSYGTVRFLF